LDKAKQRETGGQPVGARLWRAARTTSLLLGLGFASVLLINPPGSSSANHDQTKIAYVPASGPWIKLGVDQSDAQQRTAAVTPDDAITAQSEETKLGRPSRNSRSSIQLAKGSRKTLST
jgi:hypothetical protein